MITVSVAPRIKKHSGCWVVPDRRNLVKSTLPVAQSKIIALYGPIGKPGGSLVIDDFPLAP